MNNKYISSNVLKILVISRLRSTSDWHFRVPDITLKLKRYVAIKDICNRFSLPSGRRDSRSYLLTVSGADIFNT